ncbi:hypothetical protein Tco_0755145 [Tanacetum coccineum]
MSANDNFSLHDDDELSLHDDASLDGSIKLRSVKCIKWELKGSSHKVRIGVTEFLPPTTQKEHLLMRKKRQREHQFVKGYSKRSTSDDFIEQEQFEAFSISSKESLEKGYDRGSKTPNTIGSPCSGSYSTYNTSSSKASTTATPGLADEVIHSFLATNADDVDLIHEDLDQIDDLDLEEMDINWQIAMTTIKIKKFYKKTGRRPRVDGKMHVAFDKRKVECFNCHNTGLLVDLV